MNKYISGDSIKLKAEFKTFDGIYADPTNITLKIFEPYGLINELITITSEENKTDVGKYEYLYTIPELAPDNSKLPDTMTIYYEFSGLLENLIIKGQGKFIRAVYL